MRQIQFCAWSWLSTLAIVACSGGEFSTGEQGSGSGAAAGSGNASPAPAGEDPSSAAGSSGLSAGGSKTEGASPGTAGAAGSGGASSGGASSGGASSGGSITLPPSIGGAKDQGCATGSVTIVMKPSPKLSKDFLCDASCGTGWLTITDAEGATAFSISAACGTASCDTCEVQPCGAAACAPTPLGPAGSQLEWSGSYLAKDSCGDHVACQRSTCVKPGKYKARACAALNAGESEYGCTPQERQLCAEAEFEFPSQEDVVLVLEQ